MNPLKNHSESQTVDLGKRDHLCLISQNDRVCNLDNIGVCEWQLLNYLYYCRSGSMFCFSYKIVGRNERVGDEVHVL